MELDQIMLAGLFFVGGIITTLVSSLISDFLNHKRKLEWLKREYYYKIKYISDQNNLKRKRESLEKTAREIGRLVFNYNLLLRHMPKGFEKLLTDYGLKKIKLEKGYRLSKIKEIFKEITEIEKLDSLLPMDYLIYTDVSKSIRLAGEFGKNNALIAGQLKVALETKGDVPESLSELIIQNIELGINIITLIKNEISPNKSKQFLNPLTYSEHA